MVLYKLRNLPNGVNSRIKDLIHGGSEGDIEVTRYAGHGGDVA